MKYHSWEEMDGVVTCKRCNISISVTARPRRVTQCPPTRFESSIIARINYGSIITECVDFNGLHALFVRV